MIYVPFGMSVEQVWEHIVRGIDVPTNPLEADDPNEPCKYGYWTSVEAHDGSFVADLS